MRLTFHPFIVRQISSEGTGEIKGFSPEYINSFSTDELRSVNIFAPLIRVGQSLRKWNNFLAGFPAYQPVLKPQIECRQKAARGRACPFVPRDHFEIAYSPQKLSNSSNYGRQTNANHHFLSPWGCFSWLDCPPLSAFYVISFGYTEGAFGNTRLHPGGI